MKCGIEQADLFFKLQLNFHPVQQLLPYKFVTFDEQQEMCPSMSTGVSKSPKISNYSADKISNNFLFMFRCFLKSKRFSQHNSKLLQVVRVIPLIFLIDFSCDCSGQLNERQPLTQP